MAAAEPETCVKIEKEDGGGDEIKCEEIAENESEGYRNKEENLETSFCNSNFTSGELSTEHINQTHGSEIAEKKKKLQAFFTCTLCDQKTVKCSYYIKHMVRDHPGSSLQCSFCELQFENGEQFLEHVKVAHKKNRTKVLNEGGVFPCKECNKIFSKLSNLESHKRAVHNIQVSVCEFCCKEFKNKDYCRQHIRLVHESHFLDNVECDVCGKVFKSKANLYHHTRAVHEVEEDLICYICASKSRNSYMLRKHVKKCQVRAKMAPRTYVLGNTGLFLYVGMIETIEIV